VNEKSPPVELGSRHALEQAQALALMWVREAKALERGMRGYDLGKATGLRQAAEDLKHAVDPSSKQSIEAWCRW
jgi:hypothetical protein